MWRKILGIFALTWCFWFVVSLWNFELLAGLAIPILIGYYLRFAEFLALPVIVGGALTWLALQALRRRVRPHPEGKRAMDPLFPTAWARAEDTHR